MLVQYLLFNFKWLLIFVFIRNTLQSKMLSKMELIIRIVANDCSLIMMIMMMQRQMFWCKRYSNSEKRANVFDTVLGGRQCCHYSFTSICHGHLHLEWRLLLHDITKIRLRSYHQPWMANKKFYSLISIIFDTPQQAINNHMHL